MNKWCDFPRCACCGTCAYASYVEPVAQVRESKPGCLFPHCACVGLCCDPPTKKKPAPKPVHKITSPVGNVVTSFWSIVVADWDNHPCAYCGVPMHMESPRLRPTRDHIDPRSKRGRNVLTNIAIVHLSCNQDKNDLTLEQWYAELNYRTDPRAKTVAQFLKQRSPDYARADRGDQLQGDAGEAEGDSDSGWDDAGDRGREDRGGEESPQMDMAPQVDD